MSCTNFWYSFMGWFEVPGAGFGIHERELWLRDLQQSCSAWRPTPGGVCRRQRCRRFLPKSPGCTPAALAAWGLSGAPESASLHLWQRYSKRCSQILTACSHSRLLQFLRHWPPLIWKCPPQIETLSRAQNVGNRKITTKYVYKKYP
jgi:hypothetical protein